MSEFNWSSKTLKGTPDFSRTRGGFGHKIVAIWTCDRCDKELGAFEHPRDNNLPVECPGCRCALTVVVTVNP